MSVSSRDAFERAVAFVSTSSASTSNDTKLELYANFKIATVSCLPTDVGLSRPGLFDFAGRAKYDAWVRIGTSLKDKHTSTASSSASSSHEDIQAQSRARYVEIAKEKLGLDDTAATTWDSDELGSTGKNKEEDKTADELLNEVDEEQPGGGTGMVSVSTMRMDNDELGRDEPISGYGNDLHTLASEGRIDAIKAMAPSASQCNAIDSYGFTPLHLATDRGHIEVVKLLLEHGAAADIQDSEGATALDTARILENEEMVQVLTKAR